MLGAGAPILVSLAALPGLDRPLEVVALFVVLELFTNLVLETVLYAGAAGVSQVALLVSVAFWTWLWGPLGLLMATPLTVCLVVLGKHVPGLEFVGDADGGHAGAGAGRTATTSACWPATRARRPISIERHIKTERPGSVYDALLLPALNYAERDRLEERLSPEEETAVIDATRELLVGRRGGDAPAPECGAAGAASAVDTAAMLRAARAARVCLGYAANGVADELALAMLAHLVDDLPIALDDHRRACWRPMSSLLIEEREFSVVCFADLPPSASSKTRYLVKRLRAALPDVRIIVGRWAPPALADESTQVLREPGPRTWPRPWWKRETISPHSSMSHPRRTSTPPDDACPDPLCYASRTPLMLGGQ